MVNKFYMNIKFEKTENLNYLLKYKYYKYLVIDV